MLLERRIEGLLFVGGSPAGDPNLLRSVLANGAPVVTIGWRLPDSPLGAVDVTNRDAGYQATEHLLATVRSRIAEITGSAGWRGSDERDCGFDAVHATSRRTAPRRKVRTVSWSEAVHGYTVIKEILHRRVVLDGLVVPNDILARGVTRALRAHGLHVPEVDVGSRLDRWEVSSRDFRVRHRSGCGERRSAPTNRRRT
jgi:LacI family transcriptional regulator